MSHMLLPYAWRRLRGLLLQGQLEAVRLLLNTLSFSKCLSSAFLLRYF